MASSSSARLLGARLCGLLLNGRAAAAAAAGGEAKYGGSWARRALSGAPQEAAKPAAAAAASEAKKPGNPFAKVLLVGLAAGGAYTYTLYSSRDSMPQPAVPSFLANTPKPGDYAAVRKAIAGVLDQDGYDDGSYGPVLVRLAWHASGTYDKASGTGGSNGATMRFTPECQHAANAGLAFARDRLEPIKAQFPWISYADLWTLAGVVAVEEMGGPVIPWRPGRTDKPDGLGAPPDGRLPDASKSAAHIRDVFYRMGFDDREIVALIGAHALGRCHTDRSGYADPWTNAPTTFSNLYFVELTQNKWTKRKWSGPLQYQDKSKTLMMLPTDMALLWDKKFKKYVDLYAKDEEAFFKDFAGAFSKLLELGVPFPQPIAPAAA